eukprot:6189253-Pleurochrysis_carterae.AAC.1
MLHRRTLRSCPIASRSSQDRWSLDAPILHAPICMPYLARKRIERDAHSRYRMQQYLGERAVRSSSVRDRAKGWRKRALE